MKAPLTAAAEADQLRWRIAMDRASQWLRWLSQSLHPASGSFILDALLLVALVVIQETLLVSLLGIDLRLDLVTPWLMVNVILQPMARGLILALVAGFALESHAAFPAGTYLSCYWVIAAILSVSKESISWRHPVPWIVLLICAQLGCLFFEYLVSSAITGSIHSSFYQISLHLFRIVTSTGIGLYLIHAALLRSSEGKPIS